jgi:D-alanyl-D-alanine carboxypeptidase
MRSPGMKKIFLCLTIIFISICQTARAQTEPQIDAYLTAQMNKYHIPGLSLAVVREGRIVLRKGYGLANVELSVPATAESVYKIGSVTKNFTAAAVMILAEEGKITLDEKIARYLADVPNVPGAVTVRELLSHTSGIVDYTEIPGSARFARLDRLPKEVVKPALEAALRFIPGEKYEYSNTNYILLGMIIERASGKAYGQFLAERIFQPLQMTDTRVDNLVAIVKNRAAGYNWWQDAIHNGEYGSPSNKWSSGGIVSSVTDLAKWDAALRTGKILKPEIVQMMLAPARLTGGQEVGYGLGNELFLDRGHRVGGHNGEIFGFNSSFSRYLDDDLTVILLCNLGDVPGEVFAREIAGLYLGLPLTVYSPNGIEDREPKVTERLKAVILSAAKGEVDAALFTAEAQNALVPLIKRAGPELLGAAGNLKSFVLLERKDEAGSRIYLYRATFEKQTLIWTFQLTKEGKINALEPKPE